MACEPSQDVGTMCWNFRDYFRTVQGLSFGLSKHPCVKLISVMAKMNNGIGCVLPQIKCLVSI